MSLIKMKSALAVAALGMSGIMSGTAMANDIDTNQVAYSNLQAVQEHVSQVSFDEPTISVDSQKVDLEEKIVLPIHEKADTLNVDKETSVIQTSEVKMNEKMDSLDSLEKTQVESCDREANKPGLASKILGWALKGTAGVLMFKSLGSMVVPAHVISRTGSALLKNGCDDFDLKAEVYELGKTVVSAGAKDASILVEMGVDYAKNKYDEKVEREKAEKETQMADKGTIEGEVPETSVIATSEGVESELKSIGADTEPELKSIGADTEPELKSIGADTEPELKSIGGDTEPELKSIGGDTEPELKSIGADTEPELKSIGADTEPELKSIGADTEPELKSIGESTIQISLDNNFIKESKARMKQENAPSSNKLKI